MAKYVLLFKHDKEETDKNRGDRNEALKQMLRGFGAEIEDLHALPDQYDTMMVAEIPDDAEIADLAFGISAQQHIRSETLCALTLDEFTNMVSAHQP